MGLFEWVEDVGREILYHIMHIYCALKIPGLMFLLLPSSSVLFTSKKSKSIKTVLSKHHDLYQNVKT